MIDQLRLYWDGLGHPPGWARAATIDGDTESGPLDGGIETGEDDLIAQLPPVVRARAEAIGYTVEVGEYRA